MTVALGFFLKIVAVTDEAVSSGIDDAKPDGSVRWLVLVFPGSATVNDDLVAALNNVNVFHGFTRS